MIQNWIINRIISESVAVRYKQAFVLVPSVEAELMAVSAVQIISAATALIPFLEHDDANRALMGSNMQRQAVPLLYPTKPIIGTGLENQLASDAVLFKLTIAQVEFIKSLEVQSKLKIILEKLQHIHSKNMLDLTRTLVLTKDPLYGKVNTSNPDKSLPMVQELNMVN